jgi:hypothetical protein
MKNKTPILLSGLTALLLTTSSIQAEENFMSDMINDVNLTSLTHVKDWIVIPYVFSTESTGFTGGLGIIKTGLFQPQTTLVATAFYGAEQDIITNGEPDTANFSGGFILFSDYKLPFTDRLLFSMYGLKSYFPKAKLYFKGENDSDQDQAFTSSGDSNFFYTTFRYVLPIGEGIDNPEGLYNLKNGFAMGREGYGGGTPFVTGTTSLGIKTFYSHDEFENYQDPKAQTLTNWDTNGLRFFLQHENTDYDLNPSRGYQFQVNYSKDFGSGDSLQSWDFLEAKYNHYFNMPTFSWTQQNVLALSVWTGYSFSWDNDNTYGNTDIDAHRPPPWEGARLGGFYRMRGYENNRFSDKAAFYATAEYRAVLEYNPFRTNRFIPVAIDWFQVVPFVEVGRVNDTYNFDLLSDMKYDVGISLRAMAAEIPVRLDVAYGDEGTNFWVMVYQPFDF